MDLEASITERLQKLKEWQLEQQKRLLKQQQIQREILSNEKNRICKALGLPIHDLDVNENTEDVCDIQEIEIDARRTTSHETSMLRYDAENAGDVLKIIKKGISANIDASSENCEEEIEEEKEETESSNCIPTIVDKNRSSIKDCSSSILSSKELSNDLLIEGIEPLPLNNAASDKQIFDDIPLPSPKKDFQTLLEEKLKRESEVATNTHADAKAKSKRPFLKKGQGLWRFKMAVNSRPPPKGHSTPSSLNKQRIVRTDKKSLHKDTVSESPNKAVSLLSPNKVSVASGRRQLNLKTVPLPRKILNKAEAVIRAKQAARDATSDRSESEMNMSDFDSKAERELEEVRIFELLEEKAENSSFCSTSSTVLAFLQQSTPFKTKKTLNCADGKGDIAAKQRNDKPTNDTVQRELMAQRPVHVGNSKSDEQRRWQQFDARKRSHAGVAVVDSYWDTAGDTREETQGQLATADRDTSCNAPDTAASSSNSDEEEGTSTADDRDLAGDSEANASHRVRFSKYNEYRTIELADAYDPFEDQLEERRDWYGDATNSSDSSDVEEKPSLDYEERVSPPRIVDDEKACSLQQDIKDSCYRIMKTLNISEKGSAASRKDESPDEDFRDDNAIIEEVVQMSDEERSSSSLSSSSSSLLDTPELDVREKKEYILRNEPGKAEKAAMTAREVDRYPSEDRTGTFEPELLKSRLLELEKEIDIFRKESAALLLQRRRSQEDQAALRKEHLERERDFEENKRRIQNQLEEERKRLVREKAAMENRIRDAQEKARQNKMERQKAQCLQEQLENLRDELSTKESRWNAAESRYKSELRVLRVEITKLKQEVADLRNVRRGKNVRSVRKTTGGQAITKAISQINKRVVVAASRETPVKLPRNLSDASSDASVHDENDPGDDRNERNNRGKSTEPIAKEIDVNSDLEQTEDNNEMTKGSASKQVAGSKRPEIVAEAQSRRSPTSTGKDAAERKRCLYESLLKDVTSDLTENQERFCAEQDASDPRQPAIARLQNLRTRSDDKSSSSPANGSHATVRAANSPDYRAEKKLREVNQDADKDGMRTRDRVSLSEKDSSPSSLRSHQTGGMSAKGNVKQLQHSDGRIEYWYPNGNVKKIFPDQGATKMIYYNGDVRETDRDGKVRYFYAATRTWHTTTPDGLEILEFPDGQVEKRTADGAVEVSFPDGAVRVAEADGTEKWSLPDGTVARTFINGDKVLTLPNGQREVHTKDHKRREYPDGTVKLVYADGTQETRYSSGRKRLKDKDGNLLMDLYDS